MMQGLRFWGVVVKPGETVKCDPGESHYHISQIALEADNMKENVEVFVNVGGKRIMLGTLSVDKHPQVVTDQVFDKEFELVHSSMTSNICFTGYQFKIVKSSNSSSKEASDVSGDDSDEEVPLAIPLDSNTDDYKNNQATHGVNKLTASRPADAPCSISKAAVQETDSLEGPEGDHKDKTAAQDPSDDNDSKGSDQDMDHTPKGNKRPVETPLKTPSAKKTNIASPTVGKKTGSCVGKKSAHVHVATPYPAKQAHKISEHVHVATPHPAKHARKTPENSDKSKQSASYFCNSCNRTFNSSMGLEDHSRMKHGAAK
ncbi:histone deacetylase HDT2 isoform X2 [Brachypodium distachyon]|uniref:histone deacetylase HDT2 isoform X2 n=1 Tax=Brachypodium distachyon TaxID=15368 RepID=UPI000D0CBE3F|nr:histone deacetylase HDT2 isoform X2 [Brachypodium distachyon]|eukprot:XP_024315870.1 histone deacetylase HDT2 isoform X2 [Brachypodium distachyon]